MTLRLCPDQVPGEQVIVRFRYLGALHSKIKRRYFQIYIPCLTGPNLQFCVLEKNVDDEVSFFCTYISLKNSFFVCEVAKRGEREGKIGKCT